MQDISTSWKYDLLLPDSAIDGMQAMVKQLDEVTPKIDQGVKNAANEIGNRVNKALDEFEPPASTGVVGKPKKTVANELEPPKGNDLKGVRTKISELKWKVPNSSTPGMHGKKGSGTFHKELLEIIDNSKSLDQFHTQLETLITRWKIDPSVLPK